MGGLRSSFALIANAKYTEYSTVMNKPKRNIRNLFFNRICHTTSEISDRKLLNSAMIHCSVAQ